MGKKNKKSKKKSPKSLYELFPTVKVPRGPIIYGPYDTDFVHAGSDTEEVTHMNYGRLAHVASLVAFAAAALGHAVFGYGGLELVAGGLFLHAGADLIEDVLS